MTDIKREAPLVIVGPSRGPVTIDPKYTVIIGTSGETDYLEDKTGNQRFWPVRIPAAVLPDDGEETCDGIHDEGAPAHYLCSRCFPGLIDWALRGDLAGPEDDEYTRDREEEID